MSPFISEFVATAVLLALGNGVVANVVLPQTKGQNSGWIVITLGWSMAVFVGVYIAAQYSGAHLNPAVTIALALLGKFEWASVPAYLLAQICGASLGSALVWLAYKPHYDVAEDANLIRATFCTSPAMYRPINNIVTEIIATFLLVLGVLYLSAPSNSLGSLDALPVAFLVLSIGLSLGGPTGYAVNPARDFGPRLAHFILPIKNKSHSDWSYAWIPIVGPIFGGVLAALVFSILTKL